LAWQLIAAFTGKVAVMRAFILRRAFLIETGAGLVLLGASDTPAALRLQNFLRRNGVPHTMLNPDADRDATSLIDHLGVSKAEVPLPICPDGTVLRQGQARDRKTPGVRRMRRTGDP
jgi:hypothetical protein